MYICIYLLITDLPFRMNFGFGVFTGIFLEKIAICVDDFNLKYLNIFHVYKYFCLHVQFCITSMTGAQGPEEGAGSFVNGI